MTDLENKVNGKSDSELTKERKISSFHSTYLKNGQKSSEQSVVYSEEEKKEISKTSEYTYDRLGRLIQEKRTGSDDISYTYDAHNNRKEMKSGKQVTAYRYNKNDELLRTDTLNADTEQDSVALYKNDNNGNQLAEVKRQSTESNGETYFNLDVSIGGNRLNENVVNHYNALNELTETLTKDTKVSYEYDAEGLRTKKTVNGETITYVWDGDQLVMELDDKGNVLKRYIRGTSLIYSDRGDETDRQYYVMNPHGDVVQLLNQSGEVIKTYEYDSFGNEVNPDEDDDNPFRYSGEYYDKETESIYLRARYYQPSVGRFFTRDTYTGEDDDPLSLNLYTYCGNDGVNNVDPSGHNAAALNRAWTGSMWWLCSVDGPIPVGDAIYGIGVVGTGAWAVGEAIFLQNNLSLMSPSKQEIKVNYQKVCHTTYVVSKVKLTIPRTLSPDIKIGKPRVVCNQNQKVYRYRVTTRPMYQAQLTSEIAQIAKANANGKSKARADAKPSIRRISQSNGKRGKNSKTQGKSRAPKTGEPGSTYEQINDKGEIMSRTKYGKNGRPEYRDDFTGKAHYDKDTQKYLKPHRHQYQYNNNGQPIGEKILPIKK